MTKYQEKFGTIPATDCAYRVYDSLIVLREAAEKAGTNEHEAVKNAVNQISGLQGLGGVLDYTDGSGEGLHNFKEFIRVDGKNVLLKEWMESDAYAAWQAK